jgi:DNA-binding NarL/FixJ family response regulator
MSEKSQTEVVRVLIADDQQLLRDGIASLLAIQEGIEVVGQAANGQDALDQAFELNPDVVLMDVRMPVLDGVKAAAALRAKLPGCRVLMLTTFEDDEYIVGALQEGATGYLLKDIPAADLAKAIKAAHKGVYQLDPVVMAKVVQTLVKSQTQLPKFSETSAVKITDLTNREIEVLHLIAKGASNRQIADHLFISEGTVKNHVSNILSRLGLKDRNQAALFAREHKLG